MKSNALRFLARDTRDHSKESINQRRAERLKGKSLKHIVLDRFLNQYGYDKGTVTASAIIDDLLLLIEQYYRFTDNSFLKQGQLVWPAVPIVIKFLFLNPLIIKNIPDNCRYQH